MLGAPLTNHLASMPPRPRCPIARSPRPPRSGNIASRSVSAAAGAVMSVALLPLTAAPALAHVKWLASYDIESPPRSIVETAIQGPFIGLALLAAIAICVAAQLDLKLRRSERVRAGLTPLARWADRCGPDVLRIGMAMAVAATALLFWDNPVYLTPELATSARWVPVLQLAIAATLLQRGAAWYGGVGLLLLYAAAINEYGMFHLADYPAYIGLAIAMIMFSVNDRRVDRRALDVVRFSVALTFMWGGIEKFCFPGWTIPVLQERPELLMGFTPQFWLMSAGWIEFSAAFALVALRVGAQVAAVVIFGLVLSAIPLFGPIDGIGHAPFLVALFVLAATPRNRVVPRGQWASTVFKHGAVTAAFAIVSSVTLYMVYVGMHQTMRHITDVPMQTRTLTPDLPSAAPRS